jgi:subtilisin family serine protease
MHLARDRDRIFHFQREASISFYLPTIETLRKEVMTGLNPPYSPDLVPTKSFNSKQSNSRSRYRSCYPYVISRFSGGNMNKKLRLIIIFITLISFVVPASAQGTPPVDVSDLLLTDGPSTAEISPSLAQANGEVEVWIKLADAPVSVTLGKNAKRLGGQFDPDQQRAYIAQLGQKQDALMDQVRALGGRELGRVSKAHNAVAVAIDAAQLNAIAALPGVLKIRPVIHYELDLSVVRSYIGAVEVENAGFDGTGVVVAVLDSGIDYTHRNLGGSGSIDDYLAAYGTAITDTLNTTRDGLFPTEKVIEGFDFVGELWPNGPVSQDDDPIDCGPGTIPAPCAGGHGTHTSDITAGQSTDGSHKGIAPGAKIIGVKVCSSVSTSCNGVALLQGMDFALDPNQDGDISDAVDVINMSLGSAYGQVQDDLSEASQNAVELGVVVVTSAGNNADRPYIVGSPSTAPGVLSVAASFHPDAKLYLIDTGGATSPKGAVWQSWSATPVLTTGPLFYDTTNASTRLGCTDAAGGNPFAPGSHAGRILLMDRGTCAVSFKVANAAIAGAVAAVVANNVSQPTCDLPPTFSYGGGDASIPGYTITQADGNSLKASALGATATIDPSTAAPLAGNMAAFSSRGPSHSFNAIKPDITGIGTDILSAQVGTGTGETGFAGTSASAPVLAGSAALLVDAYPGRTPAEIKSVLMNTAEANIGLNTFVCPGIGAPITRLGGGEVRVNRALDSTTAAWDAQALTGSLSFGYHALTGTNTSFEKTVEVRNYGGASRTYSITPSFRYPEDAASGAVTITAPSSVKVRPNGSATFKVKVTVDATRLPVWTLNGGARGGDGFRLQEFEFDGYISIADGSDDVHLAWQILPHRAAEVTPARKNVTLSGGVGSLPLRNTGGAVAGRVDVFSLLGTSGQLPPQALPGPGDNFAAIDLRSVGARLVSVGPGVFGIQFAVNTFGTRAHPNYPAEFDVLIDTDRDGDDDYVIFNLENGGFGATGQNVVAAGPLPAGPFTIRFFTDADLDSGNAILTALLSDVGLTPTTQFDFSVFGCDNYFTGACTDAITGMTYTAGTPRYVGSGIPGTGVPAGGTSTLTIQAVPGGATASPDQTGLLLMYRDAKPEREADPITVTP